MLEIKTPHYGRISTIPIFSFTIGRVPRENRRLKNYMWLFYEHNVYKENQNNNDKKKNKIRDKHTKKQTTDISNWALQWRLCGYFMSIRCNKTINGIGFRLNSVDSLLMSSFGIKFYNCKIFSNIALAECSQHKLRRNLAWLLCFDFNS